MATTELTNLLPPSKIREFRRKYFLHLATVAVFAMGLLIFIQCALLVPSYFYEQQTTRSEAAQLARLSTNLSTDQDQKVQQETSSITAGAAYLQSLNTTPTASTALRALLAVPHFGVTLSSFTFTPPASGAAGSMVISGTASTRETLRAYDAALAALPFVTSADLPISAYAKATNISFVITLSGSLTP
jgi:Tfp pilus assembly protein PilN